MTRKTQSDLFEEDKELAVLGNVLSEEEEDEETTEETDDSEEE